MKSRRRFGGVPETMLAERTIMKRILSEVLRRKDGVEQRNGRAGALRIEFIERSRDESLGIELVFAA
jgi:hypothetical protein